MKTHRRVVKIGGSLLSRPDLVDAIQYWIEDQVPAPTFAIVGGGGMVDQMRQWDRLHPVPAEVMHWRCVGLLDITCEMIRDCFPSWRWVDDLEMIGDRTDEPKVHLVPPRAFYDPGHSPRDVPTDWRTTTDSIAAVLARRINAAELVLLKSCEIDPASDLETLARQGIVDECFPEVAAKIPSVRVVKLAD